MTPDVEITRVLRELRDLNASSRALLAAVSRLQERVTTILTQQQLPLPDKKPLYERRPCLQGQWGKP